MCSEKIPSEILLNKKIIYYVKMNSFVITKLHGNCDKVVSILNLITI